MCKQGSDTKQEPCSAASPCSRGCHRVHTLSLTGLDIGSQQEALPGAEKARKETTKKKITRALLQAQLEPSPSHTSARLSQQRPSPLPSQKLLLVHEHRDKAGTVAMAQSPGQQWAARRGFRAIDTVTSHSSGTDTCRYPGRSYLPFLVCLCSFMFLGHFI